MLVVLMDKGRGVLEKPGKPSIRFLLSYLNYGKRQRGVQEMKKNVDVAIIGGGPAAIYAAYEFVLKYPQVKVLILEEGHAIDFRSCPIIAGKVEKCIRCVPAALCGALARRCVLRRQVQFTTEFGGWLSEYIPKRRLWNSLITWMKSTANTVPRVRCIPPRTAKSAGWLWATIYIC